MTMSTSVSMKFLPLCILIVTLILNGPASGVAAAGLRQASPTDGTPAEPSSISVPGRVMPALTRPSSAHAESDGVFGGTPRLSPVLGTYQSAARGADEQETQAPHYNRPAITCTVRSKNDSGANTLRSCLQTAAAGDLITFDPAIFPPGTLQAIQVDSELPPIAVNNLTLDGSNAGVILDGSRLSGFTVGLRIDGKSGVTIRGLQIRGFKWGIVLWQGAKNCTIGGSRSIGSGPMGQGNLVSGNGHAGIELSNAGTIGNTIVGNFAGTNLAGYAADGNDLGILIADGASGNVIGGSHTPGVCDGPCNVISGNLSAGIALQGEGTDHNRILGNFIGTDVSGTRAVANNYGIEVGAGASSTQIGGATLGEGNLISGNTNFGVWISWTETVANRVWGNRIGTDVTGKIALPNYHGIFVSGSTENQIGGVESGAGNLISGNEYGGIVLEHLSAPGNIVAGNKIGADASGTTGLPNYRGIIISNASSNLIGGAAAGAGNLISGNTTLGIKIELSSTLNSLLGNLIGTNLTGETAIPNGTDGVAIGFGASNNAVGGSEPGAGNLISGNGEIGVRIEYENTLDNRIQGNRIGTNRAGTRALPNGQDGVLVLTAPGTVVGGAHTPWVCEGSCNLISGNGDSGVGIQGVSALAIAGSDPGTGRADMVRIAAPAQNVQVLGNFIGTDLAGVRALPNSVGIGLSDQANGNRIGGSLPGWGNLISGNLHNGIEIVNTGTTANLVLGNRIGTTANGDAPLPNGSAPYGGMGILISDGAYGNCVGGEGSGAGNLVSGHTTTTHDFAVQIQNAPAPGVTKNCIIGNLIGTDATGMRTIPNSGGILLIAGPTETQIRRNVISGNHGHGIEVQDGATQRNTITDNVVGLASDNQTRLPNGVGVIFFGANHNMLGPANTVAHNRAFGVALYGPDSVGNTITQSRVYGNGLGQIAFLEVPQPLAPAPVLTGWDGSTVSGAACSGCAVEVFSSLWPTGGGRTYLGSTTADATGRFALAVGSGHVYLTATATKGDGTTSEFAKSLLIGRTVYLPLILAAGSAAPQLSPTPTASRTATRTPTMTATPNRTPTPTQAPSTAPNAGFWRNSGGSIEFTVTADHASVSNAELSPAPQLAPAVPAWIATTLPDVGMCQAAL